MKFKSHILKSHISRDSFGGIALVLTHYLMCIKVNSNSDSDSSIIVIFLAEHIYSLQT